MDVDKTGSCTSKFLRYSVLTSLAGISERKVASLWANSLPVLLCVSEQSPFKMAEVPAVASAGVLPSPGWRRRQVGSFVCAKWHRYQGSVRATVISVKRHRSKSISSLAGAQLVLFGLVAPVHSLSPRNSPELTCQTIQGDRCESFPVDLTKPCEDTYLTRLNPCLRMVRADGWILPSRVCQETGHGGEFKLERRRQGEGGIYIDSFPRLISRE